MSTHNGTDYDRDDNRSLHRLRGFPRSAWEWVERTYVILALGGILIGGGLSFFVGAAFKEKALLVAILVVFVIFVIVALVSAYMNGDKARYAETIEHLHQCAHTARDLTLFVALNSKPKADKDVRKKLQHDLCTICDRLVTAYAMVTGARVQASISFTRIEEDNELGVNVQARDSSSRSQWSHRDDPQVVHLVKKNTALRSIVEDDGNYYQNGIVHKSPDYKSSYFHHWPSDERYRSILVFPIRSSSGETDSERYCGFLQVESMAEKAFNTRYDVDLGAAVADSLYVVLSSYARQHSKGANHASIP